jgi:tetratricopeptide (TPR) repeat protein
MPTFAINVKNDAYLLDIIGSTDADTLKVAKLIQGCRQRCKTAEYTEARKFADAALLLAGEINYTKGVAEANNQIGVVYWYIKDYENSLSYHLKALRLFENLADKKGIAETYTRIGHAYADMPDYDKALLCFNKALVLEETLGNKDHIADNLNLVGFIYMKRKDYQQALNYYFQTFKIVNERYNLRGQAAIYHDIAEVYEHQNKIDQALEYARKGLDIALMVGENKMTEEAYSGLEKIYVRKNDFKKAYEARLKYDEIVAALNDANHAGKIRQMEMDYAYDKKTSEDNLRMEKEAEITSLKMASQKRLNYFYLVGAILALLFSAFIYRGYRKQQAINQKLRAMQQQLIESEKMATLGIVASRMAHEMLNPLNFVSNFSVVSIELLDENFKNDAECTQEHNTLIKSNLEKIHEHALKATAIVKQLEDMSNKGTAYEFFK